MFPSGRQAFTAFFVAALAGAAIGCRSEPPRSTRCSRRACRGSPFSNAANCRRRKRSSRSSRRWRPRSRSATRTSGSSTSRAVDTPRQKKNWIVRASWTLANTDVVLMLAKLYSLTGQPAKARETLEKLPRGRPDDARVLFALAELARQKPDSSEHEKLLRQVLALKPTNLAVRLQLLDAAVRRGDADSAVRQLEEVRRLPPEPPKEARPVLEETIQQLRAGRLAEARASLERLLRIMEVTSQYQIALRDVNWVEAPLVGRTVLTFEPQSLIKIFGSGFVSRTPVAAQRFVDITLDAGLPEPKATSAARPTEAIALAVGDVNGDGTDDLFAASHLYYVQRGYLADFTERAGLAAIGNATLAMFADFDNDGRLDLFVVGADGQGHLLRNSGTERLEDVTAKAGRFDVQGARKAVFVDLDHDGDLDLLLVGSGKRLLYRNNMDGTFTESAESMGLAGRGDARSVNFADFDGDGRIDLFITNADGSDVLYRNDGGRHFSDVTVASGLATRAGSGAATVGDYDNDGMPDIFVSRVDGSEPALWHNKGDGTFTRDTRSSAALEKLRGAIGLGAEFVDIDNDGWLDLVVAGTPGNAGWSRRIPPAQRRHRQVRGPLRTAALDATISHRGRRDRRGWRRRRGPRLRRRRGHSSAAQ